MQRRRSGARTNLQEEEHEHRGAQDRVRRTHMPREAGEQPGDGCH
jgi:hypothetical protein